MPRTPSSSPQRATSVSKGPTAEEKLQDITDKIAQIRLQRRRLSPDGKDQAAHKSRRGGGEKPGHRQSPATKSPGSPGSPGFDNRVVREYFHPQLDYVIAEVAYSPYMTSPIETYPSHTLHLSGKIRNLKAMGKKSSELSQEEQPCNFAEAKKIFARIVNYKATFEGNSIDSNDRPDTLPPPLRPKTPKNGKSGLLKASCARGGPAKYARRIRLIKEQRDQQGKPAEPYRITLDPIDPENRGDPSPSVKPSPGKPGTQADPYRSPGKPILEPVPRTSSGGADAADPTVTVPEGRTSSGVADATPLTVIAPEGSTGSADYGDDFEATGDVSSAVSHHAQDSKTGESDGIYDDDDEDFESYTSKQIMQHAANNDDRKASGRAGASATPHGGNDPSRPVSKASMTPAAPFMQGSPGKPRLSGPGDVSDLEDSIN